MGLLALAGMISGAGEGLGRAASTAATFLSASALQKQREDMELRRTQLMDDNASAREQRGYAHSEKMATDAQANARAMQQQGFEQSDKTLGKTQDFTAKESQLSREEHRADRAQANMIAQRTLENAEAGTENTRDYQDATIRLSRAQLQATKDKATLLPLADGSIMRVNAQGEVVGKAMDPETGKPLQGAKDLPATTKLLVEVNKTMIQQLGEQLKNQSLMPEERNAITAQMTRLKSDVEGLLGRAPAKPGATQIVDPAATITAPDTMTAKGAPPTPAPGADEYLAQLRQEAEQRGAALKGTTQQSGQAAMNADNPNAAVPTAPDVPPAPSAPQPAAMAKMERQAPRRMQQPGEESAAPGMIAAVTPPPPSPPQTAAVPRELPRASSTSDVAQNAPMKEPDYLDSATGGPADPLVSNQVANVPRELERAKPNGLIAAAKPRVAEPGIIDPDGPPVDARQSDAAPAGLRPAANPVRKPLTQKDLSELVTVDQKMEIADMQKRVRSDGTKVQPATEQRLRSLLIKIYGPILSQSGYTPAELVENIDSLMNTLLPERTRKDRR